MDDYSPSLPENFPKERLPKELCMDKLLFFARCMTHSPEGIMCTEMYSDFKYCKQTRNTRIFNSIKEWEIEKYKETPLNLRKEKLDNI